MAINIKPNDRILVVAPHPDDESIGCGGLIALYHSQTDVLLVTDGAPVDSETAQLRQEEFAHSMALAQVRNYFMLHIPEHEIKDHLDRFKEIDFSVYTHIFVPNRYETHKDHTAVYSAVKRYVHRKSRLYEYEVWTTIRKPNVIVDIGQVFEQKKRMIMCHASQVKDLDYIALAIGLNAYRGQVHGQSYAEAYDCRSERRAEKVRHIKRKIKGIFRRG